MCWKVPGLILVRNTDFDRGFSFSSSATSAQCQNTRIASGQHASFHIPSSFSFPNYAVVNAGSKVNQKKNRVKCVEVVMGRAQVSPS